MPEMTARLLYSRGCQNTRSFSYGINLQRNAFEALLLHALSISYQIMPHFISSHFQSTRFNNSESTLYEQLKGNSHSGEYFPYNS